MFSNNLILVKYKKRQRNRCLFSTIELTRGWWWRGWQLRATACFSPGIGCSMGKMFEGTITMVFDGVRWVWAYTKA
jgi:hypothetical protein